MLTTRKPNVDRWSLVAVAAILLGVALLASTWRAHSQTFDEGVHVATGLEWLERGRYEMEPQHPPLTRVAVAVGPYLAGVRLTPGVENLKLRMWPEGDSMFFRGPSYTTTLALARAGTLPFYLLLTTMVWLWASALLGRPAAAVATALTALAPPVLGHAALATTDTGLAATVLLAVYLLMRWLDAPTTRRAALFGAAAGLALTAKFSAIPYIGLCMVFFAAWRLWHLRAVRSYAAATDVIGTAPRAPVATWREWRAPALRQVLAACLACGLVIWGVYRFSIIDLHGVPVPAGELLRGLKDAFGHSSEGHYSYLLGERSRSGWWYYFAVVIAVKTPLVLLVLGAAGAVVLLRRRRTDWRLQTPILLVLAVLMTGIITNINIGVRHILPLYAAWAVMAGAGVVALWGAGHDTRAADGTRAALRVRRGLVAAAFAWFAIDVVRETPQHLAYFNELSRRDPGSLLVDSNLDWGQDMLRLAAEIDRRGIEELSYSMLTRPVLGQLTTARVRVLAPGDRATGWVAVSETCLRDVYPDTCGQLEWLAGLQPVTRVGRSVLLYRVPERATAGAP